MAYIPQNRPNPLQVFSSVANATGNPQTYKDAANSVVSGVKSLGQFANQSPNSSMNRTQLIQGGEGGAGASTGDASGTGSQGGYTPPSTTIAPEVQGAGQKLGVPQSNTYVAPVSPTTAQPNSLIQTPNLSPVPNAAQSITPTQIGNPFHGYTPVDTTSVLQNKNGLGISTPNGGQGTISFGNKTLSPEVSAQLGRDINYNSLQSTKDGFAKEAQIVAQRHADYDAFKQGQIGRDYLSNATSSNPNQPLLNAQQHLITAGMHTDVAKINQAGESNAAEIRAGGMRDRAAAATQVQQAKLGYQQNKDDATQEQQNNFHIASIFSDPSKTMMMDPKDKTRILRSLNGLNYKNLGYINSNIPTTLEELGQFGSENGLEPDELEQLGSQLKQSRYTPQ